VLELSLIVGVVYYALYQLARRSTLRAREIHKEEVGPADQRLAQPMSPEPPAPSAGELLPLREWAFNYERWLLAELPPAEADRAIRLISRSVVPLVGNVRISDIDDETVRSIGHVLALQAGAGDARYVARAWAHCIGLIRYSAAPPERRNIWTLLDPAVLQRYDEFKNEGPGR
jgi:hypothetical protein